MAGSYSPTLINFPNGVFTIESLDGTSYDTILNSLGSYVYIVDRVYTNASSNQQLLEGFDVLSYDVSGTVKAFAQRPTVDPYQFQKSIWFELARANVVINGQTTFSFMLLPNESVIVIIKTNELSASDYLPPNDFYENDFFKDFHDEL